MSPAFRGVPTFHQLAPGGTSDAPSSLAAPAPISLASVFAKLTASGLLGGGPSGGEEVPSEGDEWEDV